MKTTFKLSLVALALVAGAAQAAAVAVSNTNKVYAYEGLTTTTGTAVNVQLGNNGTNAVAFTLPTALATGSLIRITFSVPFTTGSDAPSHAAQIDVGAVGGAVLDLANSGSNFIVYRVGGAATAANEAVTINSAKFPTAEIAKAGGLKVTISSETAVGASVDSVSNAVLATVENSRNFKVTTKLAGQIDVSDARKSLTGTVANLVTTNTAATAIDAFEVTYNSVKGTIAGDFSWVKDTNSTTAGIQAATGLFVIGGCGAPTKVTATALEYACTGTQATGLVVDLSKNTAAKPDEGVASTLLATKFTLNGTADFTNPLGLASNEVKVFDSVDAGEWKLNGSNVLVPYMVYGTVGGKAYNQVIQLTNNSKVEGAIYVDITDGEGKAIVSNQKLTIAAKPNSVTNIGSEIKALVAAAKYEGKVSIRVVAEIPSASTEVYAAYQDVATSERAIVVGLSTK